MLFKEIGKYLLQCLVVTSGWLLGLLIFFGPAQLILANPAYQSEKFLAVFNTIKPLPRMVEAYWILPGGIFIISFFYVAVFRFISIRLKGSRWKKGLSFGLVAWALMVPFFEFFLPWNVMHEPIGLVLLEMVCWLGVMLTIGGGLALTLPKNNHRE